MRKLSIQTTTVKILDGDAQLQAVAGGAGRQRPRPRSLPPIHCLPDGNTARPE